MALVRRCILSTHMLVVLIKEVDEAMELVYRCVLAAHALVVLKEVDATVIVVVRRELSANSRRTNLSSSKNLMCLCKLCVDAPIAATKDAMLAVCG